MKKRCPKCGRTLKLFHFGMRKYRKILKDGTERTYWYYQSYCYECRKGKLLE